MKRVASAAIAFVTTFAHLANSELHTIGEEKGSLPEQSSLSRQLYLRKEHKDKVRDGEIEHQKLHDVFRGEEHIGEGEEFFKDEDGSTAFVTSASSDDYKSGESSHDAETGPHFFKTWDGMPFSYDGTCDFVMVQNPTFGDDAGLDIHIRTEVTEGYTSISTAVLRIGIDTVEISHDGTYAVNGIMGSELPINLEHFALREGKGKRCSYSFFKAKRCSSYKAFTFDLIDDSTVRFEVRKSGVHVYVFAKGKEFENSVGLLGSWGKPGMIGRDGVSNFYNNATLFAEEWQVRCDEQPLFRASRAPQHPAKCYHGAQISSPGEQQQPVQNMLAMNDGHVTESKK